MLSTGSNLNNTLVCYGSYNMNTKPYVKKIVFSFYDNKNRYLYCAFLLNKLIAFSYTYIHTYRHACMEEITVE